MIHRARILPLTALLLALGHPAAAETPYVFRHDQFPDAIQAAAQQIQGIPLATQPGFVAGEAFGAFFKVDAAMYPVKIQGVDVVVAAAPNDVAGSQAHATIELYFTGGNGPEPDSPTPTFSLSTYDVFNQQTMDFGSPLQGNSATSFEFDWQDPEGHPPLLTEGNFLVAVRFTAQASDLQGAWGTFQCSQQPMLGMCGCQHVGTLHDQASTADANVLHIIYPPGNCDGSANKWVWFEDVGVTGDVILRVRATVADAPCVPDCLDMECGSDGCGGSCGECTGPGESCVQGQCQVCAPDCVGRECGDDGCGDVCGECAEDETCTEEGLCEGACEPACDGKACGDDGCDGSCGTCAAGETCNVLGKCIDLGVCDPVANCAGKECGTDGCGGVCGVCPEGEDCVQGTCTGGGEPGDAVFTLLSVSPAEGCNDEDVAITVLGSGFMDGMTAILGAQPLNAVVLDKTMIRATVPAGMKTGTHDLIVTSGDTSKFFPGAYKVLRCGTTGCVVSDGPVTSTGALLLLVALLAAVAWRRHRA